MFPLFMPEGPGASGMIALIAIVHVFVAHFAVGGGLYLILTERLGHVRKLPGFIAHARDHSRFFVLLTLVFGALTGVGIWFVIGLSAPDTTFTLIRTFVWAWAAEWCFFLIEITAALVYYKTWGRIADRTHMIVGWVYAIATIFTLLIINGILTFMLTPGAWIETHNFWDGFFNESYLPQSLVRIGLAVSFAGVFGLLTTGRGTASEMEARALTARAARWVVTGVLVAVPGYFWTKSVLPAEAAALLGRSLSAGPGTLAAAEGGVGLLGTLWQLGGAAFVLLIVAGTVIAIRRPQRVPRTLAALLLLVAFFGYGCGEYAREMLRKPYGIGGYLYANGIRVDDVPRLRAEGFLQSTRDAARFEHATPLEVGHAMFQRQCTTCHTIDGYRGMRGLLAGWSAHQVRNFVSQLSTRKPGEVAIWKAMPPIVGNQAEVHALRDWLQTLR